MSTLSTQERMAQPAVSTKGYENLISKIARHPYLEYVIGYLQSGEDINHPIKDWENEMRQHIRERYFVGTDIIANAAIAECRQRLEQERGSANGQA